MDEIAKWILEDYRITNMKENVFNKMEYKQGFEQKNLTLFYEQFFI